MITATHRHCNDTAAMSPRRRRLAAAVRLSVRLSVAAVLVTASSAAQAIPSPDLVINLSASIAQLLGLLSVVFGGFAMSSKKLGAKGKGRKGSGRGTRLVLGGVSLLLLGSVVGNILQYTSSIDARNQRLETNLVRKSVEKGEAVGDVSLKTLSFSDQLDHEQGISTETLAEWLESDVPLNIIDVRENEEYEVGAIEGAVHLRYPDVLAHSPALPDKGEGRTLLLCYSGNRSSELCGELEAQGKACNFMIGGYEKWLSESRPLAGDVAIDEADLRQLPDFANKDVLLDTPDVRRLVSEEKAEFVDVRYPDDFVADHLPGAHNITMRALPSAALAEKIAALPDVPLIAACYDKRSCFYGQLIGLRISRAGKDFRGRYTVPHEYYVPSADGQRAHVAAWQARQSPTLASFVITPLRGLLDTVTAYTGHYAFALLAVVVLVRLLLLPLALKAERDTRVQKSLKGKVAELGEELGEHPRALADATLALYRRHRIRPVVNMLASMFQLGFMLLFYAAVNEGSSGWPQPLLWLDNAADPDPTLAMPLLASTLFVAVLWSQIMPERARSRLLLVAGGAALLWMLQALGAAANLYLVISMVFLVAQTLAFRVLGDRLGWDTRGGDADAAPLDDGLVPLALAHRLPAATGKKAARLGMLIEAGYDVPDGFVVTGRITERLRSLKIDAPLFTRAEQERLDELWKSLDGGFVAVRSSGTNEDGEEASFAGVYESILNVTREGFEAAVREVHASLDSSRSAAYSARSGAGQEEEIGRGGVVVQKMVPAEYAGVMFTEHPGNSGAMMVEMVTGLGEKLVSGAVTPDTFTFGKLTGDRLSGEHDTAPAPPIDLAPLLELGRELEVHFGQPQDIEWAFAKGRFRLLQARDITRSITVGDSLRNLAERERARLIGQLLGRRRLARRDEVIDPEEAVFVQNELSELLPRPTPFSADLMGRLWASDGSTDIACRELGIPYNVHYRSVPYLVTVFGWTYVNRQEERRRLGKGPSALSTFRLARDAEESARAFRENFLPRFRAEMIERNAISLERLELDTAVELLGAWIRRFVQETYVEAERINIAADFHVKTALAKLAAAKLEPAAWLNDGEENVVARAMSYLSGPRVTREGVENFLTLFGHRAPLDYELSSPRFEEDMNLVRQYIERSRGTTAESDASPPPGKAVQVDPQEKLPDEGVLRVAVRRARDFMRLKEEAKHYCLIELAQIRRLLLAIDTRVAFDGRIFQLTIDEACELGEPDRREALGELAVRREAEALRWQSVQPPSTLSVADLERADMVSGQRPDAAEPGELAGKRVAGEQAVTGRVRVITDVAAIDTFEEGEILVARMTDPTWYPLFAKARGIVTEIGGWLSHAAIVAREYDLPAIVGVAGACRALETGDVVTLGLDGSVERLEKRRESDGPAQESAARTASVQAGTPPIEAAGPLESAVSPSNAFEPIPVDARFRLDKGTERRVLKVHLGGDRRAVPRANASGEIQPDRRRANRVANALQAYRKAS